jgi:hypothetical protein
MKNLWLARTLKGIAFITTILAVASWAVMTLWNLLLPSLFAWPALSFLQATGLLVLCRLLFGGGRGLHGLGRGHHWRQRMHERWEQLDPEERARLRKGLRHRCGPWHRSEHAQRDAD